MFLHIVYYLGTLGLIFGALLQIGADFVPKIVSPTHNADSLVLTSLATMIFEPIFLNYII